MSFFLMLMITGGVRLAQRNPVEAVVSAVVLVAFAVLLLRDSSASAGHGGGGAGGSHGLSAQIAAPSYSGSRSMPQSVTQIDTKPLAAWKKLSVPSFSGVPDPLNEANALASYAVAEKVVMQQLVESERGDRKTSTASHVDACPLALDDAVRRNLLLDSRFLEGQTLFTGYTAGRHNMSIVVMASCVDPSGMMLRSTLLSIRDADYEPWFAPLKSQLDIIIFFDVAASDACRSVALEWYWKLGSKTVVQLPCSLITATPLARRVLAWNPLQVEADYGKARLVLDEGSVLSPVAPYLAHNLTLEFKMTGDTGVRQHDTLAALFRLHPRRPLRRLVPDYLWRSPAPEPSSSYAQMVLRRPEPGHYEEILLFARPWLDFLRWTARHLELTKTRLDRVRQEISRLETSGENDAAQTRAATLRNDLSYASSFTALLALFCQEKNLYLLAPQLHNRKQMASSLFSGQVLREGALFRDNKFRTASHSPLPFLSMSPCRYDNDGRPRDDIAKILELSRKHGVVAMTTVNTAFVEFTWSFLCQTRSFKGVHESLVLLATDQPAYKALRNNPFGVHVVYTPPSSDSNDYAESLTFGTYAYGELIVERLLFNLEVVSCGANVLLMETDAVWFGNAIALAPSYRKDPGPQSEAAIAALESSLPDMRLYINQQFYNREKQHDMFEFGGGFMYMRHSRAAVRTLSTLAYRYAHHIQHWEEIRGEKRTRLGKLGGANDQVGKHRYFVFFCISHSLSLCLDDSVAYASDGETFQYPV